MRKPNLFVIGAPKCGTTALARYLDEHPNVALAPQKETWFWSSDVVHPAPPHLRVNSEQEYHALFATLKPGVRTLVDASTSYLFSECAVGKILRFNPEARFVAILRRPRDMAHSLFWEQRFSLAEPCTDFGTAWREARTLRPRHPSGHWSYCDYAWIGSFATHLKRLNKEVSPDRRLILLFEDFVARPRDVYRALLDFAGVADDGRSEFPVVNEAKVSSSPLASWLAHEFPHRAPGLFRVGRRISRAAGIRNVRGSFMNLFSHRLDKPKLPPALAAEIDAFFEPEVLRLEAMLGRSLDVWRDVPTNVRREDRPFESR
jgi:hypothetical protein